MNSYLRQTLIKTMNEIATKNPDSNQITQEDLARIRALAKEAVENGITGPWKLCLDREGGDAILIVQACPDGKEKLIAANLYPYCLDYIVNP